MKYSLILLGATMAWGQNIQLQPPAPADPVVLTVGTERITKSQFEQIIASLPEQQRAMTQSPAGKRRLAEQLSEMKLLAQDAREKKLDQSPKVKMQLTLATDNILAQNAYQMLADAGKPDDASLHAYYDAHKQDWEQIKAKHILIRFKGSGVPLKAGGKDLTEEEALGKAIEIRAKLLAGEDFSKLAETQSDDAGTAAHGGDLGEFGKGRMVPQFEKAAFAAEIGKVTEPVKSQFGYHLILVESHQTKPFDAAKGEIETKLKPEQAQKGLADLKKSTPVELDDSYFGKAPEPKMPDPKMPPPK
jgi:peptidyl-prolyl cis-trans isomerase C